MSLLVAFLIAAAPAPGAAAATAEQPMAAAANAIEAGRLDQARLLIAKAVESGASGPALNLLLADLAFAQRDHARAAALYEPQIASRPGDARLLERAGIAAAQLGDTARATDLLGRATQLPAASWRAWDARGVVADRLGDWAAAESAYLQALSINPDSAQIANNLGWSRLLQGRWSEASAILRKAVALDPSLRRASDNLELAEAALSADLPAPRPGESASTWAARLNDAGLIAQLQGNRGKAVAAFARAIEARSSWYGRAANNLRALESGR